MSFICPLFVLYSLGNERKREGVKKNEKGEKHSKIKHFRAFLEIWRNEKKRDILGS